MWRSEWGDGVVHHAAEVRVDLSGGVEVWGGTVRRKEGGKPRRYEEAGGGAKVGVISTRGQGALLGTDYYCCCTDGVTDDHKKGIRKDHDDGINPLRNQSVEELLAHTSLRASLIPFTRSIIHPTFHTSIFRTHAYLWWRELDPVVCPEVVRCELVQHRLEVLEVGYLPACPEDGAVIDLKVHTEGR